MWGIVCGVCGVYSVWGMWGIQCVGYVGYTVCGVCGVCGVHSCLCYSSTVYKLMSYLLHTLIYMYIHVHVLFFAEYLNINNFFLSDSTMLRYS